MAYRTTFWLSRVFRMASRASALALAALLAVPHAAAGEKDSDKKPWKTKAWSKEELKERLTDLQYRVTQEDATEKPFENPYWDTKKPGIYVDVVSGEPLFSSTDKFKSGTGWPSFTKPLVKENVVLESDYKLFIPRTEVRSRHADSHLGHVFDDGPEPTGKRYCINSAAIRFIPAGKLEEEGYGQFRQLFEEKGEHEGKPEKESGGKSDDQEKPEEPKE